MPKQFRLRLQKEREDGVYQRPGHSRFWYVRFWEGDRLVRLSSGALTKAGAKQALPAFKAERARKRLKQSQPEAPKAQQLEMI